LVKERERERQEVERAHLIAGEDGSVETTSKP
jgi:hypothetical protein